MISSQKILFKKKTGMILYDGYLSSILTEQKSEKLQKIKDHLSMTKKEMSVIMLRPLNSYVKDFIPNK